MVVSFVSLVSIFMLIVLATSISISISRSVGFTTLKKRNFIENIFLGKREITKRGVMSKKSGMECYCLPKAQENRNLANIP